jgi:hypothetical protein
MWLTTASAVAAEKMAAKAAKPIGIGGSRTHSAMAAAKSRIEVNASWLAASGLLGGTKENPPIRMGPRNPKTRRYADDATAAAATTRRTDGAHPNRAATGSASINPASPPMPANPRANPPMTNRIRRVTSLRLIPTAP